MLPVSSTSGSYRHTCWTVSLSYSLTHCSCVVQVFVLKSQSYPDQSCACNCSEFCMCIRSRSPHNIMHSSSCKRSLACKRKQGRQKEVMWLLNSGKTELRWWKVKVPQPAHYCFLSFITDSTMSMVLGDTHILNPTHFWRPLSLPQR